MSIKLLLLKVAKTLLIKVDFIKKKLKKTNT